MTEFAQQLQEMISATVKAAIQKETKDLNELKGTEFERVLSYFNSIDNIVYIEKEKNEKAFGIILEILENKSHIEVIKGIDKSMTIYSDSNVGYVILETYENEPKKVWWNA